MGAERVQEKECGFRVGATLVLCGCYVGAMWVLGGCKVGARLVLSGIWQVFGMYFFDRLRYFW